MGNTATIGRAKRHSCSSRSTLLHSSSPLPPTRSLFHARVTFLSTHPPRPPHSPTLGTSMRWGGGCQLRRATGASRSRGGNTVPGMTKLEGGRFKGDPRTCSPTAPSPKSRGVPTKPSPAFATCNDGGGDATAFPVPSLSPSSSLSLCTSSSTSLSLFPFPRSEASPAPARVPLPRQGRRPRPAVAATRAGSSLSPVPALSPPLVVGGEDAAAGGVVAVLGLAQAGGAALLLAVGRAGGHGGGRDAGCGMRGGRGY